jgi:hypothetical protein
MCQSIRVTLRDKGGSLTPDQDRVDYRLTKPVVGVGCAEAGQQAGV